MKKVGILSDTHGTLIPAAYNAMAECDAIIHAGDIGSPTILRELETLAPVYAVRGNNDYDEYGSAVHSYAKPTIEGVRFLVSHYPHDVNPALLGRILKPGDPVPDVCIHGHTHIPELIDAAYLHPVKLLLCPGSVSRPRGGSPASAAYVTVDAGAVLSCEIADLEGHVLMSADFDA